MIRRIANLARKWMAGRPNVGATPCDVIHRENKWRLLRYRPMDGVEPLGDSPILMVPSLINRHYILDLMPQKSFVEYLLARGHEVYIIDWGTPGDEDRFLDFEDFCHRYLGRACRKVARRSPTAKTHLLGYCLGGTLTAIYAATRPDHLDAMTLLAAPVDFEDDGLLSTWANMENLDLKAMVDAFGNIPWPLMQIGFHLLRPTMNLSKAVYSFDRATDDVFLDGFFALETWSNDNVSFPGRAFLRYIHELYRENRLIRGEFAVDGRRIDLADIACPTLNITFQHDHIVPPQSAQALNDCVDDDLLEHRHLHGGHVGAVCSSKASKRLWPLVSDWFCDQAPETPTKPDEREEPASLPASA